MNLNNHNTLQTLTIDDYNFLQLIEKEEERLELEWQETYREMARVESLINSYQQLKINLAAKLDTLELKKSEYVKKKTKLIGEMSCLPLSDKIIDDFQETQRFNSDDDLDNSNLRLLQNGSSNDTNSFSMDNIVADLLQTISEGSGTYERPESSSSVTFSSGSSDYPNANTSIHSGSNNRIGTPETGNGNNSILSNSMNGNNTNGTSSTNNNLNNIYSSTLTDGPMNTSNSINGNGIYCTSVQSATSGNGNGLDMSNNGITNNSKCEASTSFSKIVAQQIQQQDQEDASNNSNNNSICSTGNATSSQPPPPRFSSNRNYNSHKVQYNSVLSLETSTNGYVYKALNDGTVMRYRFGNPSDSQTFSGHKDKVKVLVLDSKSQLLYTGCDDGLVRSFNANTGQLMNHYNCDGVVISIDKTFEEFLVFATNKGWIYLVNHNFKLLSSHRTFNWIFAVRNILHPFKDNQKRLLVVPMKHKPTVLDATTGKVIQEIGTQVIESRPCLQVNGSIAILASVVDKSDNGTSHISVYDSANNWKCIQMIKKEGLISSMCTHGHDLYVGIKFPSYGHIQCFKWANRSLFLKWVACVAYVHTLSVMPSDVHNMSLMPSDIVLNGGPDGNVYNTTPNLKGPFFCMNKKCDCKLPFARRKDLDFHYAKLQNS
ncbi:uncharacterized protein LOC141854371 isoform X2 [Brevipalpus obovatus]|uniref:uncharacterized protein LOC141854371 isoform X2 n=1 Tax=Brevipalpus obovatus TaxID=246614 RepID=UPI003D9F4FEA